MQRVKPIVGRESIDSQLKAKRYNPALTLTVGDYTFPIASGTRDDLTVWKNSDGSVYVLSINHSLPYCSLEEYRLEYDDNGKLNYFETNLIFLDKDYELEEPLALLEEEGEETLRDYLMKWFD